MKYDRIRTLAKKAGYEEDMFGFGIWDSEDFQKFTELLIRECAWEVAEHYHPRHTYEHHVSAELCRFLTSIAKTEK